MKDLRQCSKLVGLCRLGKTLFYTDKVYGSVGICFSIEYDKTAFSLSEQVSYDHPEEMERGLNGADSGKMTYYLLALKRGLYDITIVHYFRGDIKSKETYKVIVY